MSQRFTDRLQELKARKPYEGKKGEYFSKLLRDIEEDGFAGIHAAAKTLPQSWSYTVGLYDTYGQPEIILSGASIELAKSILNEVGDRYKSGKKLHPGDEWSELLGGDYECAFRPVGNTWVERLMLSTCWFYGDVSFPALQCIYPDFDNKLPWEEGFDERWRSKQALLYDGAAITELEITLSSKNAP